MGNTIPAHQPLQTGVAQNKCVVADLALGPIGPSMRMEYAGSSTCMRRVGRANTAATQANAT